MQQASARTNALQPPPALPERDYIVKGGISPHSSPVLSVSLFPSCSIFFISRHTMSRQISILS